MTKYPGKVSKLVLVGGSPKFLATDDFPYGMPQNFFDAHLARARESYSKWLRGFLDLIFPEPGTQYLKEWVFKMSQKTPQEITINSIKKHSQADIRPLLKKIDIPTLILHGEKDIIFMQVSEGAKYMNENIHESKMYIIKDAGHFPSITAAEKFNRILKEFITTGTLMISEPEPIAFEVPEAVLPETTKTFTTPTSIYEKAEILEGFEHAVIEAQLTSSEDVTVGDEVEVRLDLVNVAKNFGLLVRVEDLIPKVFKVIESPPQYRIEDGSIDLRGKRLEPLKVETVKLSLQATEPGVVNLSPQVIYVDELGKFRTSRVEPVAITVHPKLALEFRTRAAQNVFEYLVGSFVEDYMQRRLIVQEAGWRSFVQVIKNAKVSSRSVYGSRGHHGSAISELERRGLIETRIFLGERGRGGRIVKARISYEKETVKRLVDQKVAKKE